MWPQILERLGLRDISAEEFLGALNAAAESACARGLILVDAINEGPGAGLWRGELASFLAHIEKYAKLLVCYRVALSTLNIWSLSSTKIITTIRTSGIRNPGRTGGSRSRTSRQEGDLTTRHSVACSRVCQSIISAKLL